MSARLLWQAARLTLREGAAPIRSLGKISIRPRTYQFVPLLMALRLETVRLLIADDVGVGKTIEALLIARELWERGEIRRFAVLAPPYLCDQWQKELQEKFNFDAVVVRSGTVRQLERHLPPGQTIYDYYPVQVISIDWVKTDRNRYLFLEHAPDLVIVDEAHGATQSNRKGQQLRYEFVSRVAQEKERHLILLTATPHSGIESAFRSLLGLLKPEFAEWDMGNLTQEQLQSLARHFVQRTRRDIERDWEGEICFPKRISEDLTYSLSPGYQALFQETYKFCHEIVSTGRSLEQRRRRVRYWGALALLRCVMSSPAAALAALHARHERLSDGADLVLEEDVDFHRAIFESDNDETDDEQPSLPIAETVVSLQESEQRKLHRLVKLAKQVHSTDEDTKLQGLVIAVDDLLQKGYAPIVWCRYVATAEYVAEGLRTRLSAHTGLQVVCITGRQADEERRARIDEVDAHAPRVLVATDCLSEGVNLQEKFTAVIHYDLPWNPNRLEQREGRVDRYGQTAPEVRVIRYYGVDNPVDGVVLDVLLNKAREIHKALGTYVPIPEDSESITEAVLNALFLRGYPSEARQLSFNWLEVDPKIAHLHKKWEYDARREKISRTRFAQRALKPEEVQRELEAADAVLGDPDAVREFVLEATSRLGFPMKPDPRRADVWHIPLTGLPSNLPEAVRYALPHIQADTWEVSFVSPTPAGATYVGRNHAFVQTLARFLFEEALTREEDARAARTGALVTDAVDTPTTLYLLRVRYLVQQPNGRDLFSEEVRILGRTPAGWLSDEKALQYLNAEPRGNLSAEEKQQRVHAVLKEWPRLEDDVKQRVEARAQALTEAHKRIRKAMRSGVRGLQVTPRFPVDLLGVLVLLPKEAQQ
ncbi:hypothetical protein ARMA_1405 [Ardenticatena maritima]|nr:helicase-related protein [Ardenticatena maritima]GAP62982.1 hypothetical protein ARMA_1405 [Ardenticatena maritima]